MSTSLPAYAGPRDKNGQVATDLLFRGGFAGEMTGPYLSQFLIQPTMVGALPIAQQYLTNQAGSDFLTSPSEFLAVQNGRPTGRALTPPKAHRPIRRIRPGTARWPVPASPS